MLPLMIKQQKSMAKMSVFTPMVNEIQQKYKNNQEKMQEEMVKLQQEYGYSPTAGCLPMLVNMLVLFGMVEVVYRPVQYILGIPKDAISAACTALGIAANGAAASMYNGGGSRVYLRTAASSAETGTVAYAVQHPLTFITGVSGSENDWLWSAHSDDLWSASKKSAYDPCPYGWRVAPSAVFDGLKLVGAPTAADADKYGWGLTDPERGTSSLFIGAGRRRYDNSTILNVYNPVTVRSVAEEAQPWEGLYWTAGTLSGTKSPAFHFWFEKKTTGGGLENNVPYARANGMSVRCVRVQ